MYKTIDTELLVVGGGGAALRAAIEGHQQGIKVLVVQKGIGSTAYKVAETAGFNSPDGLVDPEDNVQEFYNDILEAALGMCNEPLARILAEEAISTVDYLEEKGVPFEYDGDKYLEVIGCFANRPRMHIIKGHGEPIVESLKKLLEQEGIEHKNQAMVAKIITRENKVVGALCIDVKEQEIFFVRAKAIFLGTGGAGQLFKWNHNPPDVTGDGYALAYRAGVQLVNMEFMQSGLGTVKPVKVNFNNWIWAGYPRVLNAAGEEFIHNYLPEGVSQQAAMDDKSMHYPFSSRDLSKYIEEAIHKEIRKGNGTENYGVLVDLSPILEMPIEEMPHHMAKLWPMTKAFWEEQGVDLSKDKIEISTFGHAINGGINIDERGMSSIQGLYAAGETAGGPHGADRLGGNMLVTCQVFGSRAGQNAALYIREQAIEDVDVTEEIDQGIKALQGLLNPQGSLGLLELKKELQDLMWRNFLVVKNQGSLEDIVKGLDGLQNKLTQAKMANYKDLRHYLELDNMILVARIMATAASLRKESRGSHYRDDYLVQDGSYGKPIFISQDQVIKADFGTF